tara:strand:- start:24747 stop:26372 length:1626 start_codon:yes stop_codon:yes gene_type:complete
MEELVLGGCFYSDGGKRDFGGWGLHGYTFKIDEKPIKNIRNKEATTNVGYLDKNMPTYKVDKKGNKKINGHKTVICDEPVTKSVDKSKTSKPFRKVVESFGTDTELARAVNVEQYIDAWGSLTNPEDSNNTAELCGAIRALKYTVDNNLQKVTIISDSEYTVQGSSLWHKKWQAAGWKKPSGEPIANVDKWKTIAELQNKLLDSGKEVQWVHVYGHSGEKGNEIADKHATRGIHLARRGKPTDEDGLLYEAPKTKYDKPDNPYSRLFGFPNLYFKTNTGADKRLNEKGQFIYYIGSHKGAVELIGKSTQEHTYAVIYTNEELPIVNDLIRKQEEEINNDYQVIVSTNLPQLFSPKVYGEYDRFGFDYVVPTKDKESKDLMLWDKADNGGVQLTNVCQPPKIADRVFGYCDYLKLILDKYIATPQKLVVTDITRHFQKIEEKGKKKVPTYVLADSFKLNKPYIDVPNVVKVREEPSEVTTRLTVGIDLPVKNSIGKLIGEDFKASLITWRESDFGYRFAVVIENGDGIGIYCSVNNNLEIIR